MIVILICQSYWQEPAGTAIYSAVLSPHTVLDATFIPPSADLLEHTCVEQATLGLNEPKRPKGCRHRAESDQRNGTAPDDRLEMRRCSP